LLPINDPVPPFGERANSAYSESRCAEPTFKCLVVCERESLEARNKSGFLHSRFRRVQFSHLFNRQRSDYIG
jgi:hypothetical protein